MPATSMPVNAFGRPLTASGAQLEQPNSAALCLMREYDLFCNLQATGGLQRMMCSGINKGLNPDWVTMPPEGRRFQKIATTTPQQIKDAVGYNADYEVTARGGNEIVPVGYAGVLTGIVNYYTGTGFVEGSGDIVWRVRINQRWVKDYGNMVTTVGTLQAPCMIYRGGVRLLPQQLLRYYISLGAGALDRLDPQQPIITALFGWVNPQ